MSHAAPEGTEDTAIPLGKQETVAHSKGWWEVPVYLSPHGYRAIPALSPYPSNTGGMHKGLIQVGHLLSELWRLDVGVGHAHHDHKPGVEAHGRQRHLGFSRPGTRGWVLTHTSQRLCLPLPQSASWAQRLYVSLPTLNLPPGKGFFT